MFLLPFGVVDTFRLSFFGQSFGKDNNLIRTTNLIKKF